MSSLLVLAIGIGLALAPVAFQMFSRAPSGGQMIDEFEPYMREKVIAGFTSDLALIDDAVRSVEGKQIPADVDATYYSKFATEWPGIYADMGDMLTTIEDNRDNFAAVRALPPFALFPWFFVAPGLIGAGAAVWGSRSRQRRSPSIAIFVLGLGLIAAPFAFQMFSRAPSGGTMISDFKPLMTKERVQTMQSYFLVIGAGEGNLRNQIVPSWDAEQMPADVAKFSAEWPRISNDMAPMIGAMGDNLDNFADVKALPPFPLFPWFFVLPGVIFSAIGIVGMREHVDADLINKKGEK